jgi:hypothetical protein
VSQERAKASNQLKVINTLLEQVKAGWAMKSYGDEWRKPSLNGAAVKKVIQSFPRWLSLFYQAAPTLPSDNSDDGGEPEPVILHQESYDRADAAWHCWAEIFHIGMATSPSAEDIARFYRACKNFARLYRLAFTTKSLPWYLHLICEHGAAYMAYYGTIGKFRYGACTTGPFTLEGVH